MINGYKIENSPLERTLCCKRSGGHGCGTHFLARDCACFLLSPFYRKRITPITKGKCRPTVDYNSDPTP
jgi:hypothetical protein